MHQYRLKRSTRRKTVAIKVAEQQLTVYAPMFVDIADIEQWLVSKQSWINKQLNKQLNQPKQGQSPLESGYVKVFDESIQLDFDYGFKSGWQYHWDTKRLVLSVSNRVKHIKKMQLQILDTYLNEQLTNYVEYKVKHFCQLMDEALPQGIKVRHYKRRWGSCNRKRELTFNQALAGAPKWVVDYVIVHELAHLKYFNHSHKFWHRVALFYPKCKEAEQWLRIQGNSLTIM